MILSESKWVKLRIDGTVYYVCQHRIKGRSDNWLLTHRMQLLQLCEYAIDVQSNQVVKCRQMMEDVIDSALGIP
jgi:hypothetical protein